MKVEAFTYSRYHGKTESVGSTYIRIEQLYKYWSDFSPYTYGSNPDVLIFQKVFMSPDYRFPAHFEGIKILDICDPMWLEGVDVVETCNEMDAVTAPTQTIADFIRQFHSNVHVIPDRYDIEIIPKPKQHTEKAKTVVWFGYSHNIETFKPAVRVIEELGLNLLVISNDDPFINRWSTNKDHWYTYLKYDEATIWRDLQSADFAILPDGFRPVDPFKSNNRTIRANLAGLPVARDIDEVSLYLDPKERQKWFDSNYDNIVKEYDVRLSVEQFKGVIDEIKDKRS